MYFNMSKLIKFNTRSEFDSYILSNSGMTNIEDALSSENNGVYGYVVLITDTGEIYANNKINTPGPWGGSVPDDNFVKIEDLSEVAISGDYYDLKNTPEEITQDTINN